MDATVGVDIAADFPDEARKSRGSLRNSTRKRRSGGREASGAQIDRPPALDQVRTFEESPEQIPQQGKRTATTTQACTTNECRDSKEVQVIPTSTDVRLRAAMKHAPRK